MFTKEETPSNDNTLPRDLRNEVKNILPAEKPVETIGRPVVPFGKVLDGVLLYVLRAGCQWNMLPKEYGSGSTHVIEGFRNGLVKEYLRNYGFNYWKYMTIFAA